MISFNISGRGHALRIAIGIILLASILLAGGAGAVLSCSVSGYISADTNWSPASCDPYIVTGSVIVQSGATLTVQPGTNVKFNSLKALDVQGTLIARGTAANRITFTSNLITPAKGDWGYIHFTDSSIDASFDGSGNYISGSIIQYAVIEYAGGASTSDNGGLRIEASSPYIDHNTIQNNKYNGINTWSNSAPHLTNNSINGNTDSGIYINGGTSTISGNTITGNTAPNFGGGIYVNGGTSNISCNTITGNTAPYGGSIYVYSGTSTISGNTITGNTATYGGGININGGTSTISGNTITGNTAPYGGGVNTNGIVTISNNTITSNTAISSYWDGYGGGIYGGTSSTISGNIITDNTASMRGGGIYLPNWNRPTINNNNIYGNFIGTSTPNDIWNDNSYVGANINARNNYWNTTDTSVIDNHIWDFFDDSGLGIVDYIPILTSPVGTADTTLPAISFTSPINGQIFTTPTITVSGTASDNVGLSKVEVKVGTGSWQLASGTTLWSASVTLASGSNTIYARANDTSGNTNETSVTVTYSEPDTTTQISSCTILSSPGKYMLIQNIFNSNASICIAITSSDVTFDGAGYTIDGVDTSGTDGVYVYNSTISLENVTVKNLIVSDWNAGINYNNALNGSIINNTANSNTGTGIYLYYSDSNTLTNNIANSNSLNGIQLYLSNSNTLINNIANSNSNTYDSGKGIELYYSSSKNILTNNIANSNYKYGIYIGGSENTLTNNTANSNSVGIYIGYGGIVFPGSHIITSDYNTLSSNIANSNSDYGIYVTFSSNSTFYNNFFNNTNNSRIDAIKFSWPMNETTLFNNWNTTKTPGTNIIGSPYFGGNVWANPNGTGFSQTCTDADGDGICDSPYTLATDNIDYLPLAYRPEIELRGDVNRNGIRDTGDATLILRYIVELPTPSEYLPMLPIGDMNCNEIIDTGDATLVLREVVGLDITRCWE